MIDPDCTCNTSTGRPIDLVLVTGFLGAGKTTLVNQLLDSDIGEGSSLLVNEFGSVSVDGALLGGHGVEIFEVAEGSIFCTCKSGSFVMGLRMFAGMRRRPARVIIEASGISDPTGLGRLLADNNLDGEYRVSRVICLADPRNFLKLKDTLEAVRRQVLSADVVILNKEDLCTAEEISRATDAVLQLNSSVDIVTTRHARIEPGMLFGCEACSGPPANPIHAPGWNLGDLVSCTTPENRPATFHLTGATTRSSLEEFLGFAVLRSLRIKGWVSTDRMWWFVSDNSGRIEWKKSMPPAGTPTGLTVICELDNGDDIALAWRRAVGVGTPV